ncbi:MAG: hypothetical protein AAGA70_07160 [Pseudomonadota bacterium]
MKLRIILLTLALSAPAAAQDSGDDNVFNDGLDLFGEGARLMLEGLREEMQPMLDEIEPFFEDEMIPMLQSLGEMIDDLSAYELPERLPNGDIIIRRSPDAPPWNAPDTDNADGIEL